MMTMEDKLYAMTGAMLIKKADELGIKVACNKTRTALKEAKSAVIARIIAADTTVAEPVKVEEPAKTEELVEVEVKTEESEVETITTVSDLMQIFNDSEVQIKYSEKKSQLVVYKNKHRFVEIYIRVKKHIYTIAGKKDVIANIIKFNPSIDYSIRRFDDYELLIVPEDAILATVKAIIDTIN